MSRWPFRRTLRPGQVRSDVGRDIQDDTAQEVASGKADVENQRHGHAEDQTADNRYNSEVDCATQRSDEFRVR